jgi:hypothetical protein
VITVSGLLSTNLIRSEFTVIGWLFKRVSRITAYLCEVWERWQTTRCPATNRQFEVYSEVDGFFILYRSNAVLITPFQERLIGPL